MENQTNERVIELHFERTNFFTRWPCTFCGGTTEKVAMLCEGEGLRACEQCLEAGQDQLDERLRKTADAYDGEAQARRSLIGRVKIPTYAECKAAEKAYDDEALEASCAEPVLTMEEEAQAAEWRAEQARRKALAEKVSATIASAFAEGFAMPAGEWVNIAISTVSYGADAPTLVLTSEGCGPDLVVPPCDDDLPF